MNAQKQFLFIDILPFLGVALFWGITDVFIGKLSRQKSSQFQPHDFSLKSLFSLIYKKKIFIFMGINQLGSALYGYLLGVYPQHYSSLLANSLTILISFMFQLILHKTEKKQRINNEISSLFKGIAFIIVGIILMIY